MSGLLSQVIISLLMATAQAFAGEGVISYPVGAPQQSGLTRQDYDEMRFYFMARFMSQVQKQMSGRPLIIPDEWESPYLAAYAHQHKDQIVFVNIWGGLVRAPGMTKAVMATVLCHELGHHLGGEPRQTIPHSDWATSEGASDYFAAQSCLPEVIKDNPQWFHGQQSRWEPCKQSEVCDSVANAGRAFIEFIQMHFYPAHSKVTMAQWAPAAEAPIVDNYPSDQCRLDTFKQAALCQAGHGQYCSYPTCWAGSALSNK